MFPGLRYIPPVCILVSLFQILTGKLKYLSDHMNKTVRMKNGSQFTVFRQISKFPVFSSEHSCVFFVRFKFKYLSYNVNRIVSKIPMLLITGHPGFMSKCYTVNHKNGYWQGMYQWKTRKHLEDYKKSFVFRMMNKRALPETIYSPELENQTLDKFIQNHITKSF